MPNPPTNFSYTFDHPASDAGGGTSLFAMDRWIELSTTGDEVLVQNPHNARKMKLPREVINAMSYCREFRSLGEHVEVLMEGLDDDPARAAAIESVLVSVRDAGMSVSARDVCKELAPVGTCPRDTGKPVLVVITCDRPRALERILESIRNNCNLQAVERCFVVDDSRSADNGSRNQAISVAADARSPGAIHYFGAAESHSLVEELAARLPECEESIRFLLDRGLWRDHASHGVARNYSHLLSVGRPIVVFDDDTLCEAYEAPMREEGVEFSRRHRGAEFYTGNDEWQSLRAEGNADPVARHLQCLGLTVPEALGVLGIRKLEQESLRYATPDFARILHRDSRVLITECGTLGDPGTAGNSWMIRMPSTSRDRLLKVPGKLRQALDSRCCWHGAPRAVFRPDGNMSGVTGYDNRQFLPPYFPVTRGEDQLFGYLTSQIHPGSVVLDYPWAVPHLPLSQRAWTQSERSFALPDRFPGSLKEQIWTRSEESPTGSLHDRLNILAKRYLDLAESGNEALLERFAAGWNTRRNAQIRGLQRKIQESISLPREWQHYVEEALAQIESSNLGDLSVATLEGAVGELKGADLIRFWREAWRAFGHSLHAWGDIREAARAITLEKYGG